MNRFQKAFTVIISLVLVGALGFGIVTRLSYKHLDNIEDAFLNDNFEKNAEQAFGYSTHAVTKEKYLNLTEKRVLSKIKNAKNIFVVTVKSHTEEYWITKTTAHVDKVIRGDDVSGKDIVIYEEPRFDYSDKTGEFLYYCSFENLMPIGQKFLVFLSRINYSEYYQRTLDCYEYQPNESSIMYFFPIDGKVKCAPKFEEKMKYKDIMNYPYICYKEEHRLRLENIVNKVLEEYI